MTIMLYLHRVTYPSCKSALIENINKLSEKNHTMLLMMSAFYKHGTYRTHIPTKILISQYSCPIQRTTQLSPLAHSTSVLVVHYSLSPKKVIQLAILLFPSFYYTTISLMSFTILLSFLKLQAFSTHCITTLM